MSRTSIRRAIVAAGIALAIAAVPQAVAQQTTLPDSALIRSYSIDPFGTEVGISVCGTTPTSAGCTAPAQGMGPFGKVGPIVERGTSFNSSTNTVTRYIYAVDLAVNGGTGVSLQVYDLTETISSSNILVTNRLLKTIPLGLIGGTTAKGFMAANTGFIYIGTNQGPSVIKFAKSNFALTQIQVVDPPIYNVSAIAANSAGYVTLTVGSGPSASGAVYAPNGTFFGGVTGVGMDVNTMIGVTPRSDAAGSNVASRIYVRNTNPVQLGTAGH